MSLVSIVKNYVFNSDEDAKKFLKQCLEAKVVNEVNSSVDGEKVVLEILSENLEPKVDEIASQYIS